MQEVPGDNHWTNEDRDRAEATRAYVDAMLDASKTAQESTPVEAVLESGPTEIELATLAIMMRLYDVQVAILTNLDTIVNKLKPGSGNLGDKVYERHEKGETFNPPVYIPTMEPVEE